MVKIALLHTSFVFVTVEPLLTDLIAQQIPTAHTIHFVDSDVLAQVQRDGYISPGCEARMVYLAQAAQAAEANVIFSVCSSLGPTMDTAAAVVDVPIVKIDDAMARIAASHSGRVGVMATVPTTLGPTTDLIERYAREAGTSVTVVPHLVPDAFDILMAGDRPTHDTVVAQHAQQLASRVDTIVLAQASMSRLETALADLTGIPVLTSPRLGVADLARVAQEVADDAPGAGG